MYDTVMKYSGVGGGGALQNMAPKVCIKTH